MSFLITPLEKSNFQHLFAMNSSELAAVRAVRMVVTEKPGFPCRVSLADAEIGENIILVHYEHQPVDSPFRASHAVFVRPAAAQAAPAMNEVPAIFRTRVLSLRGFDAKGMLIAADLADGTNLETAIEAMFQNSQVDYIHIHFAKPGCYAATCRRHYSA
jgi:hypothetical protein